MISDLFRRSVPRGTFILFSLFLLHPLAVAESSAPPLIAMASDHEECRTQVQNGIRDLLMSWDEMARVHFHSAVQHDGSNALARCGLMLTEGATAEHRDALEQILSDDPPLTPPEAALLSTWLRLMQGGAIGAGEEFADRATQYRNDTLSACWAIRLLHDRYDEIGSKPLPHQERAREIARQLYARRAQDPLIAYLRGWIEESAPTVSDEALGAAGAAAETMPEHPSAQLLYGHLLFRRGDYQQALPYLHRAAESAAVARQNVPHGTFCPSGNTAETAPIWPLELRAKLYESTVLWLSGQKRDSLLLQRDLLRLAQQSEEQVTHSPAAALLHWEARTLALRLLMLSPQLPTDAQIKAATDAASGISRKDSLNHLRDCLRFCLVARQRAAAGKQAQALRCIQSAENSMKQLLASFSNVAGEAPYLLSCHQRAQEACQLAILAAKAAAYSETAEIWLQSLRHAQRPASLLMPPVLPGINP